jgi:hypothetical protein
MPFVLVFKSPECGPLETFGADGGDGDEYDMMLFNVAGAFEVAGIIKSWDEDIETRCLGSDVRTCVLDP